MKMVNVFSKIRIKAGAVFYYFCPEILIDFKLNFCRSIRNLINNPNIFQEKVINIGKKNKHVFFGYYDITPFSADDKILLAMHAPIIERSPQMGDDANVGFYHLGSPDHVFISFGKTNTWCWQQGCRLQWYGKEKNQVIYNCLVDGAYGAIVKELPGNKIIKTVKKSLYSISKDGRWGISLDFSRLQRLRPGYGYGVLPDITKGDLKPDYNGIELVNIETGEWRQLFSLKEIAGIDPHESMNEAEHYFNHIMFNPSGEKFLFFHLWISKDKQRYSRLFVANRDRSKLILLNNDGSVSHYNWISDDEIVLYSYIKEIDKYVYAILNCSGEIRYLGKNMTKDDGHPTLLQKKEIIITDTYPDFCSQRNLLSYEMKNDKLRVLARFDSPRKLAGEFRCDLHPRISNDEKTICVDRIIDGRRSISLVSFDYHLL